MSPAIDLNADLGEGCPHDAELLAVVTSASVACGAHAGSPETIFATLREAQERGTHVGAHPGYPDRATFGRHEQAIPADEVARLIVEQVSFLQDLAGRLGLALRFVKPHGALYNQAQRDPEVAAGVIAAVQGFGLPVLGLPGSVLEGLARSKAVRFVTEGFPERRYEADGTLVSRHRSDAILRTEDEIDRQVGWLVARGVQTLCIHGDDPDAPAKARVVCDALARQGVTPRPWD